MTDKIVPIGTGYTPLEAPTTASDVLELRWSVALLAEEIEQLSKTVSGMTRVNKIFNSKLDEILKLLKGR